MQVRGCGVLGAYVLQCAGGVTTGCEQTGQVGQAGEVILYITLAPVAAQPLYLQPRDGTRLYHVKAWPTRRTCAAQLAEASTMQLNTVID